MMHIFEKKSISRQQCGPIMERKTRDQEKWLGSYYNYPESED